MNKINLFIIGTQKGGTTALAEFLSQHSDIYVTDGKEAHIFDDPSLSHCNDSIDLAYRHLLSKYNNESVICDATPIYMYFSDIPKKLYEYNPSARLIVIMREPSERAFSQYQMERRRGDEPLSYPQALFAECKRLREDSNPYQHGSSHRLYSYRSRGHYCRQLDNVFSVFSRTQVLLLTNDELRYDHDVTIKKITQFLDVNHESVVSSTVFSGEYKATLKESITSKVLRLYFFPERVRLWRRYGVRL
ncbi:sulfotransferase [Aeromonas dhakensis]|uniref:sulfotransferase family protein n=1 Tax=Aeromonas dhakensis TaxID=196024 RepID=UPI00208F8799|nr:sulfotransferase [Aeromonas dhakensis]USP08618.1 sulfotransferase [Aeromonas dhakensis]